MGLAYLTALCVICWAIAVATGSVQFAIAAIAFGSVEALKSGFVTIRNRRVDINILMLLAGAGAIAIGRYHDAATLLMLFSLSATLEAMALGKTEKGIEALIKLRPKTAERVENGVVSQVRVEELRVGDLVRVNAYSQIPADGEIVEGSTTVDESAMTGEAVPVAKSEGDTVLAGTQNLEGSITIRVTAAASESSLDRVIALVQEARANKASGERISTWFGQTYTMGVVAASVISFGVHHLLNPANPFDSFYKSLVLLVALSPCALVISTPSAVLSGLACASRKGILVRGGAALEAAGRIKAVAFDKTGTLTQGKFRLRAIVVECVAFARTGASSDCDFDFVEWHEGEPMCEETKSALAIAAAIEERSTHPLALAIVEAARGLAIPAASDVSVVSGLGVVGKVDGSEVRVGRLRFVSEGSSAENVRDAVERIRQSGLTPVAMSYDGRVVAFGLSDDPRAGAEDMVRGLREIGIERLIVLTGDSEVAARAVSESLGVDEVHADLLPGAKSEILERIKFETGPVMMLGDGINDAPALATADLGVAMGGLGSDIAIRSADAVLVQDRLDRVPLLIRLGRATNSVVRQNVIISIGSIVMLAVLSLFGVLPLGIAVLGHEGTTVAVILNGLRLLRG